MIARVTTLRVKADKLDEVKKYYDDGIVPIVNQKKGFQGGYLFTDRNTGNCIAIGFWDTEEEAIADEKNTQFQDRISTITKFVVAKPVWQIYEVASKY